MPDVTPTTESGRALVRDLRGSMYERLTDERTGTPIILAIEQEAASAAVAVLSDVIDRSTPMHSATCASQDDDAPCICGTADVMDRAFALIASERKP